MVISSTMGTHPRRWVGLASIVSVLSGASCHRPRSCSADPSDWPASAKPPFSVKKTEELAGDATYKKLVAELARSNVLESRFVGAAGAGSAVFAAFESVADVATREQRRELLFHENPVVRGYFGAFLIETAQPDVAAIAPLLDDGTKLKTLDGCSGGSETLASHLMKALCEHADVPAHQDLLLAIVKNERWPGPRTEALVCVAPWKKTEAGPIARAFLSSGCDEDVTASALIALARAEDAGALAIVEPFAAAKNDVVRAAAAAALGASADVGAIRLLDKLQKDRSDRVRESALFGYVRNPQHDLARVSTLLADEATRKPTATALARAATPETLGLLSAYVDAHPEDSETLREVRDHTPSAALTAWVRAELVKFPPNDPHEVRTSALAYLMRARDAESLPEFLRSLASGNVIEKVLAAHAVAKVRDIASVPALEKLLDDKDGMVRVAAAAALVELGSKSSAARIQRAAATGDVRTNDDLTHLAAQLTSAKE